MNAARAIARCAGAVLLVLAAPAAPARAGAITGEVWTSDGECLSGAVSLGQGQSFRLLGGDEARTIPLERVRAVRWRPVRENLETNWFFPDAGQTRKETWGSPYPVRHLEAVIETDDGAVASGHLHTVAIYVEANGKTRKFVAAAKQRGQPGQTPADLTYPARLALGPAARADAPGSSRVALPPGTRECAVLAGPSLVRLPARRAGDGAVVPPLPDRPAFFGALAADHIEVWWPAGGASTNGIPIAEALAESTDFFDRRRLLAAWLDPATEDLYTLLMLQRVGATTLGGDRDRPWRCAVWRWKFSPGARPLLAGGGYLFRGILEPGREPPAVRLRAESWLAGPAEASP